MFKNFDSVEIASLSMVVTLILLILGTALVQGYESVATKNACMQLALKNNSSFTLEKIDGKTMCTITPITKEVWF